MRNQTVGQQASRRQPARSSIEPIVLEGDRVMVGDLILDLANRSIIARAKEDISLSQNEFIVLATLIKNSGRAVSATNLLTAIGGASRLSEGVIDTYIKYLRGILLKAHSSVTITRQPDEGFRLLP